MTTPTRSLTTTALICAAAFTLAACSTMSGGPNPPAQPAQNPAHNQHD